MLPYSPQLGTFKSLLGSGWSVWVGSLWFLAETDWVSKPDRLQDPDRHFRSTISSTFWKYSLSGDGQRIMAQLGTIVPDVHPPREHIYLSETPSFFYRFLGRRRKKKGGITNMDSVFSLGSQSSTAYRSSHSNLIFFSPPQPPQIRTSVREIVLLFECKSGGQATGNWGVTPLIEHRRAGKATKNDLTKLPPTHTSQRWSRRWD